MLSIQKLHVIERYWEAHLGDPAGRLFEEPLRIIIHGGEMTGYAGVFALFRQGNAIVSVPPELREQIGGLLSSVECTPLTLAMSLAPMASAIIGPAFIGYAEEVADAEHAARSLDDRDTSAIASLRFECEEMAWEHGGSAIENPCSGVFEDRRLAALAGYEVWGGVIAHISVITHPDFRGCGYGRSAVAHVAQRALEAGMLPQYRTLEGNAPAMRVAEELGFQKYATSMAVRIRG